jgi:site-specific DNA-methyltransferase (adenine-specific)
MPHTSILTKSDLNEKFAAAIQSGIVVREVPGLREAVNFDESRSTAVHRWFRYREGFSPAILNKLKGHQRVFDPFCGCGTTLIEAKRRGIAAVGTDVNPLAVFVAKVKTRNYNSGHVQEFRRCAKRVLGSQSIWPKPEMPLLPKLFQPAALDELLKLRAGLERCGNQRVKDLLLLCWLNILEGCSNIFKEGNGLKYRNKKRRPGTYETVSDDVWIPRYFGPSIRRFVRNRWREQCKVVSSDLEQLNGRPRSTIEILERSCLDQGMSADLERCDASVFSPPYANRFDYFEAFKIELWMGNFVSSPEQMRVLRSRSMRNNLTVQAGAVRRRDDLERFLDLMDEEASSVQMGIRETLRGYFDDVSRLAANLRAVLEPGGKLLCVVGNSAYAGVLIPTDLLCAQIFSEAGFVVETIEIARRLHVSSQQRSKMVGGLAPYMRESIIACRR